MSYKNEKLEEFNNYLKNRKVAIVENGTWAATASKQIKTILETMNNIEVLEPTVTIKSALKDEQEEDLNKLADAIYMSMN